MASWPRPGTEGGRLTVFFVEYGYRELVTRVASARHLVVPG
jgi:hypothetical protein